MNTAIDKKDPADYPSDSPPGFSGSKVCSRRSSRLCC